MNYSNASESLRGLKYLIHLELASLQQTAFPSIKKSSEVESRPASLSYTKMLENVEVLTFTTNGENYFTPKAQSFSAFIITLPTFNYTESFDCKTKQKKAFGL